MYIRIIGVKDGKTKEIIECVPRHISSGKFDCSTQRHFDRLLQMLHQGWKVEVTRFN